MQCSDIFILPSRQEGFPISIIEAMSSGLAVIASDIPEISKAQIEDGKDGFVFPVGDSGKMALTIEKLIKEKDYALRIGTIARQKVIDKWSTEIVDSSYKDLYRSMGLPVEDSFRQEEYSDKKKIKILYTIPNFNTAEGGENLLNVISRLNKNLFEPSICCQHERGDLFRLAKESDIPVYISNFSAAMKPRIKGLKNVYSLSNFFKTISPDIIHSYNYSDDYSEVLASKMSGIKWMYTKKNMSWGNNSWKIRTKLADAVIPQNSEMMEVFFKESNKKIFIPYGINVDEFSGFKRDENLITKHKLFDSYPIILTVGNVIPGKGIGYLIKGFDLIKDDYEKARLLIVGEDKSEHGNFLKIKLKDMGLEDRVIFAGKQDGVKSYYSIADIFMHSPKRGGEGFSISILEAMASGVISYGSDVPGLRDQLNEFPDQLFESENPGAIANKIIHAMNLTSEERIEIINRQRNFVRKNYAVEDEVSKLQELYISLVREKVII